MCKVIMRIIPAILILLSFSVFAGFKEELAILRKRHSDCINNGQQSISPVDLERLFSEVKRISAIPAPLHEKRFLRSFVDNILQKQMIAKRKQEELEERSDSSLSDSSEASQRETPQRMGSPQEPVAAVSLTEPVKFSESKRICSSGDIRRVPSTQLFKGIQLTENGKDHVRKHFPGKFIEDRHYSRLKSDTSIFFNDSISADNIWGIIQSSSAHLSQCKSNSDYSCYEMFLHFHNSDNPIKIRIIVDEQDRSVRTIYPVCGPNVWSYPSSEDMQRFNSRREKVRCT